MAQISFKHAMPAAVGELQADLRDTGAASAARAADALELQGTDVRYYSIGAVYDRGPLLLQLMLSRLSYESEAVRDQDSAMFLAGYRIGEVKPFVGYSRVRSRRAHLASGLPDTGSGAQLNAALAGVLAQSYADQHTVSLGMRWDFRRDMALKFQADAIRGSDDSIYMVRQETPRWNGKTNVFTVALDFVF